MSQQTREPDRATDRPVPAVDGRAVEPEAPEQVRRRRKGWRGRRGTRVVRVTDRRLARVGIFSTTAVAAVVGIFTALLVFVAGLLVWNLGVGSGLVEQGEELAGTVTADGTFELDGAALFAGWAALAVVWAVTITFLGFVLAIVINTACVLTGGIRLRFKSKPIVQAPAAPPAADRADAEPGDEDPAGADAPAADADGAPGGDDQPDAEREEAPVAA